MSNISFFALIIWLLGFNLVLLLIAYSLPNHDITTTQLTKTVIFTGFMILIISIFDQFKQMFRVSDRSIFVSHIQPVIKELLKFGFISFIAYSKDGISLSNIQIVIMLAVYGAVTMIDTFTIYYPKWYSKRYQRFLEIYDEFTSIDNYDDDSRNDAGLKIAEYLARNSVGSADSDETLAEVLPKKIIPRSSAKNSPKKTVATQHLDIDDIDDAEISVESPTKSSSSQKLSKYTSMPILKPSRGNNPLGNYKSCYNLVDKLYSVSPKNTFHLVTASATAITVDEVESPFLHENESSVHNIDTEINSTDINSTDINTNDVSSDHTVKTTDTNFGGGGGGGFKYKMPNGGKIKIGFGGGGGFSHTDPKDDHSVNSHTSHHSLKSRASHQSLKSHKSQASTKTSWNSISWLIPYKSSKPSVKKQLSRYNFRKSSIGSINSSATYRDYGSTDLEAQTHNLTKPDFDNYINLSLGLTRFKIEYDPIFEQFHRLIRSLSWYEMGFILSYRMLWNLGSLLLLSLHYVNEKSAHTVWVILIMKLFNSNYLNELDLAIAPKFGLKVLLNTLVFGICIVCVSLL